MRISAFREGAVLALDQLRANKFRSALTILGIVVGVATVMAMSAMIQGVRSSIMSEFEAAGQNNFYLGRFDFNAVRFTDDGPPWGNNPAITVPETRAVRQLPSVRNAIVGLDANGEFTFGRQRVQSVQIQGREVGWQDYTKAGIVAGHDMLPSDVRSSAPVVLVTTGLAEALFGTLDPIGRSVRVNGKPFQVIGVFAQADNIFAALQENLAIMPYTSVIKHLDAWTGMLGVFVVTAPDVSQAVAMDQVITTVRTMRGLRPRDDNNFALMRQEQMVETFNRFTGVFFMVMIALSSVALMVGGVGVIAIMMISVTERTREIGIRKALGATKREILWQFLFESMTVTVFGSAIGMALGASGAFLVARLTPLPASVPFGAIVASLAMAAFAGILFGIWPAWRAAGKDPVDALRYE
jgi:putative ABC transport system permease protein